MDPFFRGVAIGVLCIRRTIAGGMRFGFASGLGAAVADALYAGFATFALALATAYVARSTPARS
jgi:threonine/homoserine/homoserine lactone efflux protein